jgi:hypothetical protein
MEYWSVGVLECCTFGELNLFEAVELSGKKREALHPSLSFTVNFLVIRDDGPAPRELL